MTYVYYPSNGRDIPLYSFLLKRISRFYPLYLVSVLVMVPFLFGTKPNNLIGLVLDIFLLQTWVPGYYAAYNAPGWAMSVMVAMYVIFPFVMPWMKRKGLRFSTWFVAGVWVLNQVVVYVLYHHWNQIGGTTTVEYLIHLPIFHLSTFMVGILLGLHFHALQEKEAVDQKVNSLLLVFFVLLYLVYYYFRRDFGIRFGFTGFLNNGIIAPIFAGILLFLALDATKISEFLSRPWLIKLGEISFSIYLLQSPLAEIYQAFILNQIEVPFPWMEKVHLYLYIVILIPFAFLIHHVYEKPVQRLMRKRLNLDR